MRLVEFKRKQDGRAVFVNPEFVVWTEPAKDPMFTLIFLDAGEPLEVAGVFDLTNRLLIQQ